MNKIYEAYIKFKSIIINTLIVITFILFILPFIFSNRISRADEVVAKEKVALYLMTYHELPANYISKGSINRIYSNTNDNDFVIGGDTYFDTLSLEEYGIKPHHRLRECDIAGSEYSLNNRGSERLVYTSNQAKVRVFYTNDFKDFKELTPFRLQLARNICWIIFGLYAFIVIIFGIVINKYEDRLLRIK